MIPVPETVMVALCEQLAISRHSLVYLGGGREDSDGVAFTYPHPEGARVLKVMAVSGRDPDSLLPIQERIRFVYFLGKNGVDIVYPLELPDGSLFTTCPAGDHLFIAYCMKKVEGVHARGELNEPDFVQRYGQLIGKLHHVTQQYPTWQHSFVGDKPVLGWEQEWQEFYDRSEEAQVKKRWLSIRGRLEMLPVTRESFGFVHNDPHVNNLLFGRERLVLLDFDVANYHWFINDIAITLQPVLFSRAGGIDRPLTDSDALVKFLSNFIRGYRRENALADFWLDQVDLFISYRRLLLYTVMQGWLSKKPGLRGSWIKMILSEPSILS